MITRGGSTMGNSYVWAQSFFGGTRAFDVGVTSPGVDATAGIASNNGHFYTISGACFNWTTHGTNYRGSAVDVAIGRRESGIIEVTNGTLGNHRDIMARKMIATDYVTASGVNVTTSGLHVPVGTAQQPAIHFGSQGGGFYGIEGGTVRVAKANNTTSLGNMQLAQISFLGTHVDGAYMYMTYNDALGTPLIAFRTNSGRIVFDEPNIAGDFAVGFRQLNTKTIEINDGSATAGRWRDLKLRKLTATDYVIASGISVTTSGIDTPRLMATTEVLTAGLAATSTISGLNFVSNPAGSAAAGGVVAYGNGNGGVGIYFDSVLGDMGFKDGSGGGGDSNLSVIWRIGTGPKLRSTLAYGISAGSPYSTLTDIALARNTVNEFKITGGQTSSDLGNLRLQNIAAVGGVTASGVWITTSGIRTPSLVFDQGAGTLATLGYYFWDRGGGKNVYILDSIGDVAAGWVFNNGRVVLGNLTTGSEGVRLRGATGGLSWSNSVNYYDIPDLGIYRNTANLAEINTGTRGVFADLKLRDLNSIRIATVSGLYVTYSGIQLGSYSQINSTAVGQVSVSGIGSNSVVLDTTTTSGLRFQNVANTGFMTTYMHGSVFDKDPTASIKVDPSSPTYAWADIIGVVRPDPGGANAPVLSTYRGNVRDYRYIANDKIDLIYHIPHDYVMGTDIHLHLHWSHTGTAISGSLVVDYAITYAKGHNQANFIAPVSPQLTVSTPNITTIPQYRHRVDEIQISASSPSGSQIDTDDIEPDGIILVNLTVNTAPTITAGDLFLHTADIHYQTTNLIGTKQRVPNFWI
jgi:hypothetical protein